jgi:hypothetical protein
MNDIYMTLLMTGWMFLFMGLYYKDGFALLFGICLVVLNVWCIRTQYMVTDNQYILGMIPHHSMAVHMSKQLAKRESTKIKDFVSSIVRTQEQEIKNLIPNCGTIHHTILELVKIRAKEVQSLRPHPHRPPRYLYILHDIPVPQAQLRMMLLFLL